MNATELLKEKYPEYIIKTVRKRFGLEENDTSEDQDILEMSKSQVFSHVVNWNGLLGGYDHTIKSWISDIYGVDLDEDENEE